MNWSTIFWCDVSAGLLLLAVAFKALKDWRKYDNGYREFRKKLFGFTLMFTVMASASTMFAGNGYLDWRIPIEWIVLPFTAALIVAAFTLAWLYFVDKSPDG